MESENDEIHELVTPSSIIGVATEKEREEINDLFDTDVFYIDCKRIAVLSDIHSNMVAFSAVIEDLKNRDFDVAISLGDLVGYYTQPNEVLKASKPLFMFHVMGNHDFAAIEPRELLFTTLNEEAKIALKHNREILTQSNSSYLSDQPMKMVIDTPYGSITAVHGDPLTIFGYIYGSTEESMEKAILEAMENVTTDFLFVGHTHVQGYYRTKDEKI